MGLKMGKCGFSSLNLFSALTWSARCPRSDPKRRSIARPGLSSNAPARYRLLDEYVSASASRLSSDIHFRQQSILDQAHDLRHLLHDLHLLHDVFSTFLGHPSARLGPHLVSVSLELLLVPPHLHRVLSLHHVENFSDTLLSSVLSHPPTWRFQLRFVCGNLQSVLELAFPPRDIGTRGILQSVHVS